MKKILFLIGLIVFITSVNAQNPTVPERVKAVSPDSFISEELFSIKEITSEKEATLGEYVSSFSLLETDDFILNKIVTNKPIALEVDVPFNQTIITLQLISSNIIRDKNSSSYKRGAHYYGIIKNQTNTLVSMSFFTNNIIGIIADDKGNHVIGKSDRLDNSSNEYILYNDKKLLIENNIECGVNYEPTNMLVIPEDQQQMMVVCEDIEIGIYIEADHQLYLNQGSNVGNVETFVDGIFNVVATLYQNESITIYMTQPPYVWQILDPYAGGADIQLTLDLFETQMSAGFNGNLAHLFSGRLMPDYSGYANGGHNNNVLCGSDQYKTAASAELINPALPFPNYSYSAYIVTHEIGHNLGSGHTHECLWNGTNTAIDGCGTVIGCPNPGLPMEGTIMSYCNQVAGVGVNFNLGFGTQPGDIITNQVNNAACLLTGCCDTDVFITGNNYNTALTESDTWIVSSGQTTIENTADVRLDADPVSGYIEFEPVVGADFFLAEPVGDGVFVAEALDGCDVAIPAKMVNPDGIFAGNDVENTKEESTVKGFLLEQNIPNPFSEKTTIKASIPDGVVNAEIVIYNLHGIQLESYAINERGKIAIEISGGKLAAGVYLYTLLADGKKIDTKKMILTK